MGFSFYAPTLVRGGAAGVFGGFSIDVFNDVVILFSTLDFPLLSGVDLPCTSWLGGHEFDATGRKS
jgi:hypothetical protein